MPKVSVIIPAYNNARYVGQAVESVFAQTYKDYEIIVVDDGSTDHTADSLKPYMDRIRYVYQANQERSIARNRGVAESRGEYLAFLDSDDAFLPNKLAIQVAELDRHPQIGLVASGYEVIDQAGHLWRQVKPWERSNAITLGNLLLRGFTIINAILLRRVWFVQAGGFDRRYHLAEDQDLWFRLCSCGCKMKWVKDLVCQYRMHDSNSVNNVDQVFNAHFIVVENLFQERSLSPQISRRKSEILARLNLRDACRLYDVNKAECAKARIREAIRLFPILARDGYLLLFLSIANWLNDTRIVDQSQFLDRVIANPPLSLSLAQRKMLFRLAHKPKFFASFSANRYYNMGRLGFHALCYDPQLLFNRGAWSMLLHSVVG